MKLINEMIDANKSKIMAGVAKKMEYEKALSSEMTKSGDCRIHLFKKKNAETEEKDIYIFKVKYKNKIIAKSKIPQNFNDACTSAYKLTNEYAEKYHEILSWENRLDALGTTSKPTKYFEMLQLAPQNAPSLKALTNFVQAK